MAARIGLGLLVVLVAGCCQGRPDFSSSLDIDSDEHGQYTGDKGTNCTCGWSNKMRGRVVGGREAQVNEYPYMAGLASGNSNGGDIRLFCGASILTPHHALTAAHCTYQDSSIMFLIVGEHDITDSFESRYTKLYMVSKVVEHERYNDDTNKFDIALLVTKRKIEFNMAVGPICLPPGPIDLQGQIVKVAGWGALTFRGPSPTVLMKTNLRVVSTKDCAPHYPAYGLSPRDTTQFCTYARNRDSCQGDSGGPVVWLDPETNRYTLAGVVSFGNGCADVSPGVNTQVSAFLGWIQHHIKKTSPSPVSTCSKVD